FEVIKKAAEARRTEDTAVRWIIEMLKSRTVEATVCRDSISLGVTKGGILSPILCCMVRDALLVKLNEVGIFTRVCSADVFSLGCGDVMDNIGDLMRAALSVVEEWCQENKLRVNPIKTKIILFSRRRNDNVGTLCKIALFGKDLNLCCKVKYLGVKFDKKMTW